MKDETVLNIYKQEYDAYSMHGAVFDLEKAKESAIIRTCATVIKYSSLWDIIKCKLNKYLKIKY